MATQAQILANRSNAQKSTGPRTAAGKAVVAQNAVRHGLCGRDVVIKGEDPGEFELQRERMLAELDPVGEMEVSLAERVVGLSWRLKRAERLQAAAFDSLLARQMHHLSERLESRQDDDGDSTLGRALVRDFSDSRVLDKLLMYERRIEQSLYRTMAEIRKHRLLQEVEANGIVALRRALARGDDAGTENHGRDARATGPAAYGPAYTPEDGSSGNDPGMDDIAGDGTSAACGESARSVPVRAYLRSEEDKITPDGVTTNEKNHGRDARATKPPTGAAASDEGRATLPASPCKTKPILPPAADGQVPCYEELTADSPRDEPGETKPISDPVRSREGAAARGIALSDLHGRSGDRPTEALCRVARSR